MAKLVRIMVVVDDDWSDEDLNYEANDALVKHNVVHYVESVETLVTNYDDGRPASEEE